MADEATGSTDETGTTDDNASEKDEAKTVAERKELGGSDEGLKADLAAERAKRHAAEQELEKVLKANQTDQEKAIDEAKLAGKAEALDIANARVLKAEVTAAAAGKLADPSDAVRHLDLSQFTVDDDGNVDAKKIGAAIDALVSEKPYLAGKAKVSGDGGGGPRGTPAGGQKTMNDLIREKAGRT